MAKRSCHKKNLFFTERAYFKGAYIYIVSYLAIALIMVMYFRFVHWLYGMNPVVQRQLLICIAALVCMIIPIPVLIVIGYRNYRNHPPIAPNWKQFEGEITTVGTSSFNGSIYWVTVNVNGLDREFKIEYDKKVIDPELALVYAREDNKINVMVNLNNTYEGKILAEEYFERQAARNLPRIQFNDGSYKYNELHVVGESQKIIVGELDRKLTKCFPIGSIKSPYHGFIMDAVISCYEKENQRLFQFKCRVCVPRRLYTDYINHSKTPVPVEVIVDRMDYSKYTVLLNKALEDIWGKELDRGWLQKKVF